LKVFSLDKDKDHGWRNKPSNEVFKALGIVFIGLMMRILLRHGYIAMQLGQSQMLTLLFIGMGVR
jgi:hypothetical protein